MTAWFAKQQAQGLLGGESRTILLLARRADSLTDDLIATSVIASVIMAVVGVRACAARRARALRVQPTEALQQG